MNPLRYQSPIPLNTKHRSFPICQNFCLKDKNKGAKFIPEEKIFLLQDKIIMKINGKPYILIEYHFHVPAEHTINNKTYPAEVHYVFEELSHNSKNKQPRKSSYCSCCHSNPNDDINILVIGRVIKNSKCNRNLSKLQVNIPSTYFEYDGSLTGEGDGTVPVRWIVGNRYIRLSLNEIHLVAKTARPIQPLDDRIILFDKNN